MAKGDSYKEEAQPEVELLAEGIKANNVLKGPFLQNVWKRKNAWEVRAGFGQVAQYDSTLGYNDGTTPYGFNKILGSQVFRTDFGHTQVLTLLTGRSFTGSTVSDGYDRGQWATHYTLSVFDLTTQDRWEELLIRHTSEAYDDAMPMSRRHGAYESTIETKYDFTSVVQSDDKRAFFCEFQDTMLFGTPKLGVWCYAPAMFMGSRSMQFDGLRTRNGAIGYSESPRVFPITPKDGQFSAGLAYLGLGSFPTPVDICAWNNRVVYAAGRTLYFSDQGNPHSIQGLAVQSLQIQNDITAIAEVFDNLYVFTDSETCVFRPDTQSADGNPCGPGASFRRISEVVGCIGPQAHVSMTSGCLWASRVGIHTTTGQYDLNTISDEIQPLFDEQLANPLQNFFTTAAAGFIPSTDSRPIMEYDWSDVDGVSVCYNDLWKMAIVTVPSLNMALVRQDSTGWVVWNFETLVNGQSGGEGFTVSATNNMMVDSILSLQGETYAVGGIEMYTPNDHTEVDDVPVNENAPSGSYIIMQLDRGGALDRSVSETDDRREFAGWYEQLTGGSTEGAGVWLDKGVKVPQGYVLPQGAIVGTSDTWLVPIVLSATDLGSAFPMDSFSLDVQFDNKHWRPIFAPGQTVLQSRVDAILPPERAGSEECYGLTAITLAAGTSEVQVYDGAATDQTGNLLRIRWTGINSVFVYSSKPNMNIRPFQPAVLLWIPMRRLNSPSVESMGWWGATAEQRNTLTAEPLYVWAYHQRDNNDKHKEDDTAQAVDWVLKSAQVGADLPGQVMARSLFTRFLTHGKGDEPVAPLWPFGLFNTVLSSDWKDWASQVVDFNRFENTQQTKVPLRDRVLDSSSNMKPRTFANTATWGTTANETDGNFLIDDEQVDVISISDGVRGESVSWMLFGHMMNRAERIAVESATAVLRVLGGRRRIGR